MSSEKPELKSSSPLEQRAREYARGALAQSYVHTGKHWDLAKLQDNLTNALVAYAEKVRAEALEEAARTCESSDRYRGDRFAGLIRELLNGDTKP